MKESIKITRYIYPVVEKIELSNKLGLFFDNPRSDGEIIRTQNFLEACFQFNPIYNIPSENLAKYLHRYLEENIGQNPYFKKLLDDYARMDGYEILARMWIIERSTYASTYVSYFYTIFTQNGGTYLEDTSTFSSFLEEYFGEKHDYPEARKSTIPLRINLLLLGTGNSESIMEQINSNINRTYTNDKTRKFESGIISIFTENSSNLINPFQEHLKEYIEISRLIEKSYSFRFLEKITYLSEYLKILSDNVKDEKIRILILVNMIEFIITHTPRALSLEESVSYQFQGKLSELICKHEIEKQLDKVKERLREIYHIRSCIAHGDFQSLRRYFDPKDEIKLDCITRELCSYLRIIIMEFLNDPTAMYRLKML